MEYAACSKVIRAVSFSSSNFLPQDEASAAHLNLKPLNSKISSYMRSGLIQEAQKLFDEMPQRNIVTWNAMLHGYFQNKQLDRAMSLFHQMPQRDIFSYNTLIMGLMQGGDVDAAKVIFNGMAVRDVVSWNSMVSGYVRNGLIEEAVQMFDESPLRDVISWNLVIGGLVKCGKLDLAEDYFRKMSVRDVVSWTIMISGLARAGRIIEARHLFEDMPIKDIQAWNAMIVGYLENGHVDPAKLLFQQMPKRDFESWKLFIGGLVNCRQVSDGMRYFMEMPHKCQKTWNSILLRLIRNGQMHEAHAFLEKSPYGDVVSWTNLIVGYFEIGDVGSAIKLFEMMPARDATMWNVIIFGLGENNHGEEGVKFFLRMRESGPFPDEATFTSVLTICSCLPSLRLGRQTHTLAIKMGFNHFTAVSNAMVTMYARCGNVHSALVEFSSMPHHDVISWNSIICGFAHHGNAEKALEIFEQMRPANVKPNQITFIGVLSACSHVGLVAKGKFYFDYMKNKCLLQPTTEHYTCIVDLLGRFGLIDEAMHVLDDMRADGIEIPASVWGALLGACRIHNKMELGEIAGEKVLEVEPDNSGVYLILSEMYLTCGRIEDAERIWYKMKEKRVKKQPGCSWIEINDSAHVFLSGDCSHYEFFNIYYVLHLLQTEMESNILKSNIARKQLESSHACYG